MGFHDGVSKVWVLRRERGLSVEGYADELEAIDALIRHALTWGHEDMKKRIQATVAKAITHCDELVQEDGHESDGG